MNGNVSSEVNFDLKSWESIEDFMTGLWARNRPNHMKVKMTMKLNEDDVKGVENILNRITTNELGHSESCGILMLENYWLAYVGISKLTGSVDEPKNSHG